MMTALMKATIAVLLLAVPASAQTPTATPTATPRPPVSPDCPIPTPVPAPTPAATSIPTAAPEATATPTATPLVKTPQNKTVAIFLVDSTDNGTSVLSRERAEELIWTNPIPTLGASNQCWTNNSSLRSDLLFASYDILEFLCDGGDCDRDGVTYDIFGPYESLHTLDEWVEQGVCDNNANGTCAYCLWSDDAQAMAVAAAHLTQEEMDAYDFLMFSLPWNDNDPDPPTINLCPWGGLGIPGGRVSWINMNHSGVIRHEMGHTLGFPVHIADPTDFNGSGAFGLNATNLIKMDFMPSSSVVEVENEGRQEFLLLPSAVDPYDVPGIRVVKIVVPSGDPYYISFRDDTGMDRCIVDSIEKCKAANDPWDCCTGEKEGACGDGEPAGSSPASEFAVSIHRWNGGGGDGLEVIPNWLRADDTFTDEDRTFQIEVTNISQGAEHWEMEMAVTFLPQPRKVAAILIETSDCEVEIDSQDVDERIWTNPLTPVPAEASDRLLISGRERWLAASYGILDLVRDSNPVEQPGPDVFGPYEITGVGFEVSGLCTDKCDYNEWGQEALQAARAEYPELIDYDHIIHYMPGGYYGSGALNNCSSQSPGGWGGLGQNGGKWVWVNSLNAGLIMHELGHNFNVQASDDPTDMMGTNDVVGLNAPHMLQLEFLPNSEVLEVTSDSTVTLLPLYVDPYDFPGTRVVKILAPSGDPYYISFRDDSNIDINLREEDQFAGFIHRWNGDNVVSDRQKIGDGETFADEEGAFRFEVTDISQGVEHWEMEIEVTFLPTDHTSIIVHHAPLLPPDELLN
jgi:hypothetical protein